MNVVILDIAAAANLVPEPGDIVFAFGADGYATFRHVMLVLGVNDGDDETAPGGYTYAYILPRGGNITIRTMLRRSMSVSGRCGRVRTYDDIFSHPEWSRTKSFVIRQVEARDHQ